ncbi:hypothetical protein RNZ50_23615 [Paracoccaceae bacterium Fryx2]|nr:hypothetical protein [Paracoccaceae bacterium Fryx2]
MPDAILIGAGHNALGASLHLAAKGWRVCVLEQAAEPGGAVRAGEDTLPGFRQPVAVRRIDGFQGIWRGNGGAGLAFAPVADCHAGVSPMGAGWGARPMRA